MQQSKKVTATGCMAFNAITAGLRAVREASARKYRALAEDHGVPTGQHFRFVPSGSTLLIVYDDGVSEKDARAAARKAARAAKAKAPAKTSTKKKGGKK